MEAKSREKLEAVLIDAESARFRDLRRKKLKDGTHFICGRVNAKNRMGGYIGYRRFLVEEGGDFAVVDPGATQKDSPEDQGYQAGFDAVWPNCEGGP